MAEYIERKVAIDFVKKYTPNIDGETTMQCVETALENVPTADVVSVVRCCKCKYGNKHKDCNGNEYYGCDLNIDIGEVREVEPTHYCGYGERRCDR